MKTTKTLFIVFMIFSLIGIVQAVPENITFTTSEAVFTPMIEVSGSPEILWTFADGTTNTTTAPSINYGSAGSRNTTLKVTPWSAITEINLGYHGADGGVTPGPNTIADLSGQPVTAIYGLENTKDSLINFAACGSDIATPLVFDNFTQLDTVELFSASGITSLSVSNTSNLTRLCVEGCSLPTLDVSGAPNLLDLRTAKQGGAGITTITWGSTVKNWHICCHTNPTLTMHVPVERFTNLTELMTQGNNQTGEFNPGSSRLKTAYANDNLYTSANLTNITTGTCTVRLQNCYLTSINLTGAKGLYYLNLENNSFDQIAIDKILADCDALGTPGKTLKLEDNVPPSAVGISHACNLISTTPLPWTVTMDMPTDLIILGEKTSIAAGGTMTNATTKTRTLADIKAAGGQNSSKLLNDVTFIPSAAINVTVIQWDNTQKVWNESSETHDATTQHIIGGFTSNSAVQINRDSIPYEIVKSNATGYIDWTYIGGYSEYQFEAEPFVADPDDETSLVISSYTGLTSTSEDATNVELTSEQEYSGVGTLYETVKGQISSGYVLASLIILVIGATALLRYFGMI